MGATRDSQASSYREALAEHLLLAELLTTLWQSSRVAEVLKPIPGQAGYDVVIDCEGRVRYLQIKSTTTGARTAQQFVHTRLARYPSACVVWAVLTRDMSAIDHFLWYGERMGQRLTGLGELEVARHTKANAEGMKAARPSVRRLPRTHFRRVKDVHELVELLFEFQAERVKRGRSGRDA
ncbi:hypothetical protein FJ251_06715 [bacterium]|nr:hypothetical protein [bacterium]